MGVLGERDSLRWKERREVKDLFRSLRAEVEARRELKASPGEDITEIGIVICYERGFEIGLSTGIVLEGRSLGAHLGLRLLVRVGSFDDTISERKACQCKLESAVNMLPT